jgi:hypothetical protein
MGTTVIGADVDWLHVITGHPEMQGRELFVGRAISNPDQVFQGNKPNRKTFVARNITTGFWAGYLTVAIVRYDARHNTGYLVTAYLAPSTPLKWVQIWP